MPIQALVGLPRNGKSYNAVAHVVLPALREGRRVVTNLPLNLEVIAKEKWPGTVVDFPTQEIKANPARLIEIMKAGDVLVIDELYEIFPAGLKADKVPEPFKIFLAQHAHMVDAKGRCVQIVFITQDLSQVSAFARSLVETTLLHTKLTALGMAKRFRVDIYQGAVTGTLPSQNRRIRQDFGTFKEDVGKFYRSHMQNESDSENVNESPIDPRANILTSKGFVYGAIIAVFAIGFGVYRVVGTLRHPASNDSSLSAVRRENHSEAPVVLPSKPPTPAPPSSPPMPVSRASWRVSGWIRHESKPELSKALLTDGTQTVFVSWDNCRDIPGQPVQCQLEGVYYSETGKASLDAQPLNVATFGG